MLALLNIGFFEMVLLAAAAVLLFGGDLPDVARKAARFVGRMRALSQDLTREFQADDLRRPPGLRRPPELDRPRELDLRPDERRLFDGKLTERPRAPFEGRPEHPAEAELGPPRATHDEPTAAAGEQGEPSGACDSAAPATSDAPQSDAEHADGSDDQPRGDGSSRKPSADG